MQESSVNSTLKETGYTNAWKPGVGDHWEASWKLPSTEYKKIQLNAMCDPGLNSGLGRKWC